MANIGPLIAQIGSGVWGTQQISTGFASWLRYCNDTAHRRSTKLCKIFGHLLGWYTIYTFSGALARDRVLPGAKFMLRPSLAFSFLSSDNAWHFSSGVSQTFQHGTRNGITELSKRAPPIFSWAAITLDIGPHSSMKCFMSCKDKPVVIGGYN